MTNRLWDERHIALLTVLKSLRTNAGFTQADLADQLGKPQSYVSKYESGERRLDFVECLEICDILDVKPEKLIKSYRERLSGGS